MSVLCMWSTPGGTLGTPSSCNECIIRNLYVFRRKVVKQEEPNLIDTFNSNQSIRRFISS